VGLRLSRGSKALKRRRYREATRHAKAALSVDPKSASALELLGDIDRRLKRYKRALKHYKAALKSGKLSRKRKRRLRDKVRKMRRLAR
jgi:tetratricopeptide (TPR) repeat protein